METKNALKLTVDFASKTVTTDGMIHEMKDNVDGTSTFEEAGIINIDRDSIEEYFTEKYEDQYDVEVEFTGHNFHKSAKASVWMSDLADLGWELSDEIDSEDTYHIDITVDEKGKTFWNLTNTQREQEGIWEGSDMEKTGDDEQTIKDLYKLHSEGKLWDVREDY